MPSRKHRNARFTKAERTRKFTTKKAKVNKIAAEAVNLMGYKAAQAANDVAAQHLADATTFVTPQLGVISATDQWRANWKFNENGTITAPIHPKVTADLLNEERGSLLSKLYAAASQALAVANKRVAELEQLVIKLAARIV